MESYSIRIVSPSLIDLLNNLHDQLQKIGFESNRYWNILRKNNALSLVVYENLKMEYYTFRAVADNVIYLNQINYKSTLEEIIKHYNEKIKSL